MKRTVLCLLCLCLQACSNSKPAPYVDKSTMVFGKDGPQPTVDVSPSPMNRNVYLESSPLPQSAQSQQQSEIVEHKLAELPSAASSHTHAAEHTPTQHTQQHASQYALDASKLEQEVDAKSAKTPNASSSLVDETTVERAAAGDVAYKIAHPLGNAAFDWPLHGKVVSRFGKIGNKSNEGIDIAAPLGTNVTAIGDGKVVYVGKNVEGYGNLLIIRHPNDVMSAYAHLKEVRVERSASVKKGQSIGTVGQIGDVSQPQLHFSVRKGKKTINPEEVLK